MTEDHSEIWEQIEHAEQLIENARNRGDRQTESEYTVFLGSAYFLLGQISEAIAAYEHALPLYRETHSLIDVSDVLCSLGSVLIRANRISQAVSVLEEALALAKEAGDGNVLLKTLFHLGSALTEAGQLQQAISYHQEALTIIRINGDKEAEMHALGNLGGAYSKLGRGSEALLCHEQALLLARELGNTESEALELGNLGYAYTEALEQPVVGIHYFEQALALFRAFGDQHNEAKTLVNIAGALWKDQRSQEALQMLEHAKGIANELGDRSLLGSILSRVGHMSKTLGQFDEALSSHQRALLLDQGYGDRQAEGLDLNSIGLLHRGKGQPEQALQLHREALAIARERKDRLEEARQIGNIAWALIEMGKVQEGVLLNRQAIALFQELGDARGEGRCYICMGIAFYWQNKLDKCLAYWRMGHILLNKIEPKEAEITQKGIDDLNTMVADQTFRRFWQFSEKYLRWLHFQRYWIAKETSFVNIRRNDFIPYQKHRSIPPSSRKNLNQNIWQQGDAAVQAGQRKDALAFYQQALHVAHEMENAPAQALLLGNIGCIYASMGQNNEAAASLWQSLATFRTLKDRHNEIITLMNLGMLLLQSDTPMEAIPLLEAAMDLVDAFNDDPLESIALRKVSAVYQACDDLYEAKRFLGYALDAAQKQHDLYEQKNVLIDLGRVCLELGQTNKARTYFQQAQNLDHACGDNSIEGELYCLLAIVYAVAGKFTKARETFLRAQELFREQHDLLSESQMNIYLYGAPRCQVKNVRVSKRILPS